MEMEAVDFGKFQWLARRSKRRPVQLNVCHCTIIHKTGQPSPFGRGRRESGGEGTIGLMSHVPSPARLSASTLSRRERANKIRKTDTKNGDSEQFPGSVLGWTAPLR